MLIDRPIGLKILFITKEIDAQNNHTIYYDCRDNPIVFGSMFYFACANTDEVIYVLSAIIGYSLQYSPATLSNGQPCPYGAPCPVPAQCPMDSDTCTVTYTTDASTYCNGINSCTISQRILLSNESGSGLTACNGGSQGGNFINVNYTCINPALCVPIANLSMRFNCNTAISSVPTSAASTSHIKINSHTGLNQPTTTSGETPAWSSNTTDGYQLIPTKAAAETIVLSNGTVAGIVIGVLCFVILLMAVLLAILILKRRKLTKQNTRRTDSGLQQNNNSSVSGGSTAVAGNESNVRHNPVANVDVHYQKFHRSNPLGGEIPDYYNIATDEHNYEKLHGCNRVTLI